MDLTATRGKAQEVPGAHPSYLSPKQLARELQISERMTYQLLKEGSVPSVWVGGRRRIPRAAMEQALAEGKAKLKQT